MSASNDWLDAFPVRPATDAVEALCDSWRSLATRPLLGFHPKKREPELTRALKAHVEQVTGRQRGLLGMWATEGVINTFDELTGQLIEERRTDIVYGWNNDDVGIQLVFEFKKLSRSARDRAQYLGEQGLGRFVSGIYGRGQAVAAMMGILTDPIDEVIPPLLAALDKEAQRDSLRLHVRPNGKPYDRPSILFAGAEFDTEHSRAPDLAPRHGTIRVAHFGLAFGYTVAKRRKAQNQRCLEASRLLATPQPVDSGFHPNGISIHRAK